MKIRFKSALIFSLIAILTIGLLPVSASLISRRAAEAFRRLKILKPPAVASDPRNKITPRAAGRQVAAPLPGQTATQLSDGRWIMIGGEASDGPTSAVGIKNSSGEGVMTEATTLNYARSWHTATMLPDGSVLVIGGIGIDGKVIKTAEVFDPQTQRFETVSSTRLTGRAYHTATLLTEGVVFIAGGMDERGKVISKTELWHPETRNSEVLPDRLKFTRYNHTATLMADGNVLLSGGADKNGRAVKESEIYYPASKRLGINRESTPSLTADQPIQMAASLPESGAMEVPLNTTVAIRFSKPARAMSVNANTASLVCPYGAVQAKVVPAEGGMLAFVTASESLLPETTYTLTLSGLTDANDSLLPVTILTFITAQAELSAGSDDEQWIPGTGNPQSDWQTRRAKSPWQSLPPLQAESGTTAIAGQALTLNGKPLANVTMAIDGNITQTDKTGRFLLKGVPAGRRVLLIDGRSASRREKRYGLFEAGVNVEAGKTSALGYTVWMPRLDTTHEINISSPTQAETVITTPYIPGLELHIPPNTTLYDHEGNVVTRIGITPIPIDRTPFPLPKNVYVPIYFTIQPGGARVKVMHNEDGEYGEYAYGARLYYPNYRNERAGKRANFWHYDPEEKGWYVYGKGSVTADRKQVIPDLGVSLKRLTGAMINDGDYTPPADGGTPGGAKGADPVDLSTGLFTLNNTDLAISDTLPIAVTRTYRQSDDVSRQFGVGTTLGLDMRLWSANQFQEVDLVLPDGGRIHYVRTSGGISFDDAVFEHTGTQTGFYKSKIHWNGHGWDLVMKDGSVYVFGEESPLQSIRDRFGNTLTITRSGTNTFGNQVGNITRITSPNGRYIDFTYDTDDRVSQITDNIGRTVGYTYDTDGNLWKVTNPNSEVTEYTYDASHRMQTIKDARNIVYLTNEYDTNGRVSKQTQADMTTFHLAYTLDSNNKVTRTDLTDPRGNVRRITFNSSGYILTDTYALGEPEEQTYTYELETRTNLVQSVTDALGRRTAFTYDSMGNVTSVTGLDGTPEAVTSSFTYEPTFNKPATATDPLNHTVSFDYDSFGNLTSVTDPLKHQATFAYNSAGQMTSATTPVNKTTQFDYETGDLVAITNPIGQRTQMFSDPVGRVLSAVDPMGRRVKYQYDVLNRVTKVVDPLQGMTQFAYDPNGNLLSVTDASNHAISYTYDNMDRAQTRTDALLKQTGYTYNNNGSIHQVTDRRNQATGYNYDALNRLTRVTYHDGSTTDYTYDDGNRLTQIVDSTSGTITYAYDNFSRVTTITTPQGAISYTYDAAGRRTSMTVPGQTVINYSYDNANRLTQIQQGTFVTTFGYDAASRLTSRTLPNSVITEYAYDDVSRLVGITYKKGSITLGDLTYEYDAAGRRARLGGSLAYTGIPQALTNASYNAGNRQTAFAAQTLTYDDNGNLTSDGTNTFTWNARNQLASMSGPGLSATFTYDALGRRTGKTVNGSTTGYLYDGANVVQEQVAANPSANIITAGLDIVLTRSDSTGTVTPLTDPLGSTIALADSSGAIQTQYSYEPFGKTTATGAASSNPTKYTGRDDDGTGLYYYRARYYSPTLQRFISEDPIGAAGGINLYAYVGNDPVNFVDSFGLERQQRRINRLKEGKVYGFPDGRKLILGGFKVYDFDSGDYLGWVNNQPGVETDWGMQFAMAAPFAGLVNLSGAVAAEGAESEEAISVYHGSINDAASIRMNGFDPSRGTAFVSRDLNAASNAIGAARYEVSQGLTRNIGLIESRIPKSLFQRHLAPFERPYSGFGGGLTSTEITLRTAEQMQIFNRFIVR